MAVAAVVSAGAFLLVLVRTSDLMVDVAERDRTQAELARLAAVVEASDGAIIGLTPDGTITSWNAGAERLFGHRSANVTGRQWSIIVGQELPPGVGGGAGRTIQSSVLPVRRNDGTDVVVSISASPIRCRRRDAGHLRRRQRRHRPHPGGGSAGPTPGTRRSRHPGSSPISWPPSATRSGRR